MKIGHLVLGIFLILSIMSIFGQVNTSAILGTVTDPTGAVIPGATVVVTNVETGVASRAVTDNLGNYAARFLPPGRYRVDAESAGFKKFIRQDITLDSTRELRVDLVMETGVVTESVTVTGRTSMVETETGTLSATIEQRQVVSLPIARRDPQLLALLMPGVIETNESSSGMVLGYSRVTGGGLIRRDVFLLDGSHNVNHVFGTYPVNPNPDTLQEFKVLTNSFSAEYGETSGGVMIATTKSGANEFHGTLFEFFRNDKLNAGNFFTHQRPVLRYNLFGGTFGGPIQRNKTFFFLASQLTREHGATAYTNYSVPLPEFRRGDFSRVLGTQAGTDVLGRPVFQRQIFDPLTGRMVRNAAGQDVLVRDPFLGNVIPVNRLSPAALKISALYPSPLLNTPFSNFSKTDRKLNHQYTWDAKGDHNISEHDKLMVRYSWRRHEYSDAQPFGSIGGGGNGNPPGFGYSPGHNATGSWVHIFGGRATNSLQFSWYQEVHHRNNPGTFEVSQNDLGIFGLPNGALKLGVPVVNFTNFNALGQAAQQQEYRYSQTVTDNATLVIGRQTLKFGGELRKIRTDIDQPSGNTTWNFSNLFTDQRGFGTSGFDFASFMLGLPRTLSYQYNPDYFRPRTSSYALYVQDDIRVSRRLTVNIGLRWDAPLWFNELHDRAGIFNLDLNRWTKYNTPELPRRTQWEQEYWNWGPRFGFAYSPFGDNKTVIRGGYGMFQLGVGQTTALDRGPFFGDTSQNRYDTTDQVTWRTTLDSIPYLPATVDGSGYTSVSINKDRTARGYMQQMNFNVSRDLAGLLVEVGWAGSIGMHLPSGNFNLNAIPLRLASEARGRFIAPYVPHPQFPGGVTMRSWIGKQNYHSLQLKAERRFAAGFGFLANYTWAKTITSEDGGFRDPVENRAMERGLGDYSAPHRINVAWNYELPFGKGKRWLTGGPLIHPFGGWEINGATTYQAGFPLTPGMSFNSSVTGGANRPNLLRNATLPSSERRVERWFDVQAFSLPALYTTGNAGRGVFFGPGRKSVDINLAKRFYGFGNETRNLELRAEFFNLFNSPLFENPNTTIDSATAGRISLARNERQIQLALKFYF